MWYLDDGTLVGSPEDLNRALEILKSDGPLIGLEINPSKFELYWPTLDVSKWTELPADIPRSSSNGTDLLGGAFGEDAYVDSLNPSS